MNLSDLQNGDSAVIVRVSGHGAFRRRIIEMGFVRGQKVTSLLNSPLNDPVKYGVMGYEVSLRRSEAAMIEVMHEYEANLPLPDDEADTPDAASPPNQPHSAQPVKRKNEINVALVGNPNSGKTSLFNVISGGREHVGNYSGVTVAAKTGHVTYKGYRFNITDLPGTYSLSAYSPEERFVRQHIFDRRPDVILNVVVASNLERNLYLTTELIDLGQPTIAALNMYDELKKSGAQLNYAKLGGMIGVPMVPTVARTGDGISTLLDTIIDVFEGRNRVERQVNINYGTTIEPELATLSRLMQHSDDLPHQFPPRYWALKFLEGDTEAQRTLRSCTAFAEWRAAAERGTEALNRLLGESVEAAVIDRKYGYIAGALRKTYTPGANDMNRTTDRIDRIVAHKWLGFPIFILLMWLTFTTTFQLGQFPQDWIEAAFGWLGDLVRTWMPQGPLRDLLADGVIGGVGSVTVFLPNILLLYLFISLMEDSGYMARAAFIMDRLMHRIGLHGKSFIPMLMGFGCNVPAIMATRTIESHSSRLITILINPFMSCSARLPVYILLVGTFFSHSAGTVLISLYALGILMAALTAIVLRRGVFKADETPFVMELPPYRLPTLRATLKHMWDKGEQYMKKIGGVILLISIIIWFLSYYPRTTPDASASVDPVEQAEAQYEHSYLGRIGKFFQPVMAPMHLNWKATVALLSGAAAKEVIVSTMGVLYSNADEATLSDTLAASGDFTPRSALSFLVFILLYCPCIASLATIAHETGSRKWVAFSVLYNTGVAWVMAYGVYLLSGTFWGT